jgi:hypothetical protein
MSLFQNPVGAQTSFAMGQASEKAVKLNSRPARFSYKFKVAVPKLQFWNSLKHKPAKAPNGSRRSGVPGFSFRCAPGR